MPTVREHHSKHVFKCMMMGDPGSGKTGSLPSLINHMDELGLKQVAILDFDDGLDILLPLIEDKYLDRVFYETLVDDLKTTQDDEGIKVREAKAFPRACALLNNWVSGSVNLGPAREWGKDTVFVIDSITGVGDACMWFALDKLKSGTDWEATGAAMRRQEKLIDLARGLSCHLIVMSHVRFMGGGGTRASVDKKSGKLVYQEVDSREFGDAYPSVLGKKLPPTVGRFFNTILEIKLVGKNRYIRTVPDERMNLKLPLFTLPEELDQKDGLYRIFKEFLARGGESDKTQTQ